MPDYTVYSRLYSVQQTIQHTANTVLSRTMASNKVRDSGESDNPLNNNQQI